MKKIPLLFLTAFLYLSAETLPSMINLNKLKPTCKAKRNSLDLWHSGNLAFNAAPEIAPTIIYLKKLYNIQTVVETGTCSGNTTALFSSLFDRVHTIEFNEKSYDLASRLLSTFTNVNCHLGSSTDILPNILPNLENEFVLFYLDAHWGKDWPLLGEIEEIAKTHKDQCIIIIDDIKVPERSDFPYDKYEENVCSYEYIAEKIKEVFTDHTVHYLLPFRKQCRAKLIILPKRAETGL